MMKSNKILMCMIGCIGVIFICLPPIAACAQPAPTETIVLKAITCLPEDHPTYPGWWDWIKKVNEQAKGQLKIDYLGGPEVIPAFEQTEALRKGIMHVNLQIAGYYTSLLPEALCLYLSRITPWEERKSGYHDYVNELHAKINVHHLARTAYPLGYYLYGNVRAEKPEDLAGKKFRAAAYAIEFMKALGIAPVSLKFGEIYTALDRGMVDGFSWAWSGVVDRGWSAVCKYVIGPSFFDSGGTSHILMNLDSWKQLPDHLQKLLTNLAAEHERKWTPFYEKYHDQQLTAMMNAGMQHLKFSSADSKRYIDLAYDVTWKSIIKKRPDTAAKLKELSSK